MAFDKELKIKQEILKIERDIAALNKADQQYYQQTLKSLQGTKAELEDYFKLSKDIQNTFDSIRGDTDFIYQSFKRTVDEMGRGNKYLTLQRKSLDGLSDVARDLLNIKNAEGRADENQIKNLKKQYQQHLDNLKTAKDFGNLSKKELSIINQQIKDVQKLNKTFEDVENTNKEISKQMGGMGDIMGAIGKAMPNLSEKFNLGGLQEEMEKIAKQNIENLDKEKTLKEKILKLRKEEGLSLKDVNAGKGSDQLKNLVGMRDELSLVNKAASSSGKGLGMVTQAIGNMGGGGAGGVLKMLSGGGGLGGLLGGAGGAAGGAAAMNPYVLAATILLEVLKKVYEAMKMLDGQAGAIAKGLNLTYGEATKVNTELVKMADNSNYTSVTTKKLGESLMSINKSMGTNAQISAKTLETFTMLKNAAGVTDEAQMSMLKTAAATGEEYDSAFKSFQSSAKIATYQKGVAVNTKQLFEEQAKLSNRIKISMEGGASALGNQMVRAKVVGLDLEKAAAAADQLLDFESSIESEMQAELMLGKNLNLEKARQAALNNDLATAAEEIAKNVGSAADFTKMNRLQQEALAKSVGMTADGLADMLVEQEALKSMGRALSDDEKKAFEFAKEKYGLQKATEMLNKDGLERMSQQQSVQEKFADVQEKMMEVFVKIAEPLMQVVSELMPLFDVLMVINKISIAFSGLGILIKTLGPMITNSIVKPFQHVKKAFDYFAKGEIVEGLKEVGKYVLSMVLNPIQMMMDMALGIINSFSSGISAITEYMGLGAIPQIPNVNLVDAITGDDVVSQGYGKRTLLMDKGAIALNDKDTVIAGTDLFSKGDDVVSGPVSKGGKKGGAKGKSSEDMSEKFDAMVSKLNDLVEVNKKLLALETQSSLEKVLPSVLSKSAISLFKIQ